MSPPKYGIRPYFVLDESGNLAGIEIIQDYGGELIASHVSVSHLGAHNQAMPCGLERVEIHIDRPRQCESCVRREDG